MANRSANYFETNDTANDFSYLFNRVADIDDSTGIGGEGKKNPLTEEAFSGTRLLEGWAKSQGRKRQGRRWDKRLP